MRKVLLLYPTMLFYKIPIFNKLEVFLKENGYELIIWATSYEDRNTEIKFKYISNIKYNYTNYKKIIKEKEIDIIINILFKSKPSLFFYLKALFYAKISSIPIIFYGHGINLGRDNALSNFIYNLFYLIYDGIILYTPKEKNKLWKIFHHKITIAYNTLDLEGRKEQIKNNKQQLKNLYNIRQNTIVLTTGRLQKRKRIDILFNIFSKELFNSESVAWVIVGPEIDAELLNNISKQNNIYYLGAIYDKKKISEIFFMSDIYSIPGWMGLGVNEAMYWGLPILTMNTKHAPEIYYLKDGKTGFIVNSVQEFSDKLNELISNEKLLSRLSKNSIDVFNDEASLNKMFSGFLYQLKRFE